MRELKLILIGVAVGILISIVIPKLFKKDNNNKTTTDSTYVDKKIIIPKIEVDSTVVKPEPILVIKPKPEKVKEFKDIKEDSTKVKEYVKVITNRVYKNTYTDKDSIATIIVKDSVEGFLREQNVVISIKERPIEYKELTVTKTIKERPVLSLSLGAAVRSNQHNLNKTALVGLIGLKFKKGSELIVGYDSNNYFIVGLKMDIFTLYK